MSTVTERVRKIERLQAEADELYKRLRVVTEDINREIEQLPRDCHNDVFVCQGSGFKVVDRVDDGRRPIPVYVLKRHSILIEEEPREPSRLLHPSKTLPDGFVREGRYTYHCPACNGKLDPTNLQFCGHCNWQDDSLDIDAAIDRGHAMDAEET